MWKGFTRGERRSALASRSPDDAKAPGVPFRPSAANHVAMSNHATQQQPRPKPNDIGPWRDGRYVVASRSSQMPHHCMVCGMKVDALTETAVPLPRDIPAHGLITATHFLLAGERFRVSHGRCERH